MPHCACLTNGSYSNYHGPSVNQELVLQREITTFKEGLSMLSMLNPEDLTSQAPSNILIIQNTSVNPWGPGATWHCCLPCGLDQRDSFLFLWPLFRTVAFQVTH